MDDDRIRLAEAMGWEQTDAAGVGSVWRSPDNEVMPLPDPFTDANDDYAVLEWAIKNLDPDAYFRAMTDVVGSYCYLHEYRIGYFARAALKVLDDG